MKSSGFDRLPAHPKDNDNITAQHNPNAGEAKRLIARTDPPQSSPEPSNAMALFVELCSIFV
jgi:hypothetical protein